MTAIDDPTGSPPQFVAYVYPGWHHSAFRPSTDEWDLLETFRPYFEGHLPPPQPVGGAYDDADPATTRRQLDLAAAAGVDAFLYFMYYGPAGFVLSAPMDSAVASSAARPDVDIAGAWCVRLPHDRFPVPDRAALEAPRAAAERGETLATTPVELLTMRDLTDLVGPDDQIWSTVHVGSGSPEPIGHAAFATDPPAGDSTMAPGALSVELPDAVGWSMSLQDLRAFVEDVAETVVAEGAADLSVGRLRALVGRHPVLGRLPMPSLLRVAEAVTTRLDDPLACTTIDALEQLIRP
jgi:hypothetical protein